MDDKHQNVRVITAESDSKFVFDSCCCCIPLRIGCLILGYLQLVGLILFGLFAKRNMETGVVLLLSHPENEHQEILLNAPGTIFVAICAAFLVLLIISIPFTILLLVGLHMESRNCVKVYLVFMVVGLLSHAIFRICKFVGGYATVNELPWAVISILLSIYFFLVLRSQFIKMGFTNNVPTQHYRDGQLMNIQKD